jgi:hypothetical protein
MPKKLTKNPRIAPMYRFVWKEWDVRIIHDPYAAKRKEQDKSGNSTTKKESE